MPYATISRSPSGATEHLAAVAAALGAEPPDGLLARVVGESTAGLQVVEVWQTQAQHDRFVAERLYPAFQRLGRHLDDRLIHVAFDVADLYLANPTTEEFP